MAKVKDVLFQGEDEVIGEYLKISGADYQVVAFLNPRGGGDGKDVFIDHFYEVFNHCSASSEQAKMKLVGLSVPCMTRFRYQV
ncbi:MAG: hypothetical protein R2784_05150 [Saprospiraceae bacterium]